MPNLLLLSSFPAAHTSRLLRLEMQQAKHVMKTAVDVGLIVWLLYPLPGCTCGRHVSDAGVVKRVGLIVVLSMKCVESILVHLNR